MLKSFAAFSVEVARDIANPLEEEINIQLSILRKFLGIQEPDIDDSHRSRNNNFEGTPSAQPFQNVASLQHFSIPMRKYYTLHCWQFQQGKKRVGIVNILKVTNLVINES